MEDRDVREQVRAALEAKPDSIVVGRTEGQAMDTVVAMGEGTDGPMTTVRLDGSGFVTYRDGTVTQLTAEEAMLSLGSVTIWDAVVPAERMLLVGPTVAGRTASMEQIIDAKAENDRGKAK